MHCCKPTIAHWLILSVAGRAGPREEMRIIRETETERDSKRDRENPRADSSQKKKDCE
jgi:hypothetical protein